MNLKITSYIIMPFHVELYNYTVEFCNLEHVIYHTHTIQ